MSSLTTTAPQTRRALLGAGLGALAATVAEAFGRAAPSRAANGQTVTVGGTFTGTTRTSFTNTASQGNALEGHSGSGNGMVGRSGNDAGVVGQSDSHIGVYGIASDGGKAGIYGQTFWPGVAGGIGHSAANGTGLLGFSGPSSGPGFTPPVPRTKTGVFGHAAQDSNSRGVWGNSPTGHGVHGSSDDG
jgi:hypothetical protein